MNFTTQRRGGKRYRNHRILFEYTQSGKRFFYLEEIKSAASWTCNNLSIPLNCDSPPKDEFPNQLGSVNIKRRREGSF